MNVKEYIGKRIFELRTQNKISQQTLADCLGYTRTSIVNIEAGRQGLPVDQMWTVCNALHCTPNDLFPETNPMEYKYEEVEKVIYERVARTIKVKKLIL